MLKAPRFMTEYASHKKKNLNRYDLSDNQKSYLIKQFDSFIAQFEKGFITVDETMFLISDYDCRLFEKMKREGIK